MTKISKMISAVVMFIMMFILLQSPIMVFAEDIEKNIKSKQKEKSITAVATSKELQDTLSEDLMSSLQEAGVKMYASKEEYEAEQKAYSEELMAQVAAMEKTPIWHTFTVRDKKTGVPISGAVIVLDGVPRFSDINGQIQVKMMNDVVELKVEKNGYNPYVEYYDVYTANENGTKEKVVYIKQPSDDLEIYSATLDYYGEKANVVEQSYSMDAIETEGDTINLNVASNDADMYYLYNDNVLIATCSDGQFKDIPVSQLGNPAIDCEFKQAKNCKLVTEKGSIKSKPTEINIFIVFAEDLGFEQLFGYTFFPNNLNFKFDDNKFLNALNIDFSEYLKKYLTFNLKKGDLEFGGLGINLIHDNLNGVYQLVVGVDLGFEPKHNKKQNKALYNKFKRSYNCHHNNPNPLAKNKSVMESLAGAFKTLGRDRKKINLAGAFTISFDFSLIGCIEISDKVFTDKNGNNILKFVSASVTFDAMAHFDFTKHFLIPAGPIAIPIYISLGGGIGAQIEVGVEQIQQLQAIFDLTFKAYGKIGAGFGIKGLATLGVYGKLNGEITLDLTAPNVTELLDKYKVSFSVGVLLSILGYDIDFVIIDDKPIVPSNLRMMSENSKTEEGYIDARPQVLNIGGKLLSVWVERNKDLGMYNSTQIKYSYDNKTYVLQNDGTADFYPELRQVGNETYIVWHNSTRKFEGNDTLESVFASSEICYAKFDKTNGKFGEIGNLFTSGMNTLPKILKTQNQNENLAISWLGNSNNDPFGLTGTSYVNVAVQENGNWVVKEKVFEINAPIASYDVSYINGEIYLTAEVDTDCDFATTEDKDIYFGKLNDVKNISNDKVAQTNPQFGILDNSVVMFYHENGKLKMSDFSGAENSIVVDKQGLLDNYSIVQGDNLALIYFAITEEGQKSYLAQYKNGEWITGIKLDDSNYIGLNAYWNGDKIEYVGVVINQSEEGDRIESSSILSGSFEVTSDISIESAYFLDNVKIGENVLYSYIKNNGGTKVEQLNFDINGTSILVNLENSLNPSEEQMIVIKWNCDNLPEKVNVFVSIPNVQETNLENNSVEMNVDFSSFEMQVQQKLVGEKEILDLLITNTGKNDTFKIVVRKNNKLGEIIFESEKITLDYMQEFEYTLNIDYTKHNCHKEDKLFIEIVSEKEQLAECNYTYFINEKVVYYNINDVSKYLEMLETAKKILGGVI